MFHVFTATHIKKHILIVINILSVKNFGDKNNSWTDMRQLNWYMEN